MAIKSEVALLFNEEIRGMNVVTKGKITANPAQRYFFQSTLLKKRDKKNDMARTMASLKKGVVKSSRVPYHSSKTRVSYMDRVKNIPAVYPVISLNREPSDLLLIANEKIRNKAMSMYIAPAPSLLRK